MISTKKNAPRSLPVPVRSAMGIAGRESASTLDPGPDQRAKEAQLAMPPVTQNPSAVQQPTAAPAHFPYTDHRTLAQVDTDAFTALARDWRKGLAA